MGGSLRPLSSILPPPTVLPLPVGLLIVILAISVLHRGKTRRVILPLRERQQTARVNLRVA